MNIKTIKPLVPVALTLVGLGVGFGGGYYFRGMQLQRQRMNFGNGANFARFANGQRTMGPGMMQGARGGVFGSVLSIDEKGITVKLADGSSKIVLFTDATTYSNTATATKTDLKVGESVAVFGAPNSDGSVSATNVQINPEFFRATPAPSPK